MIHFIYGEDTYRSEKALKELESSFVFKYGDLNVDKLEGGFLTTGLLQSKAIALPFLSDRRLVIIKRLLKEGTKDQKKEAETLLKNPPELTDLVFYEEGLPDKRETIFKQLEKTDRQVFNLLNDFQLKQWIEKELEADKIKINPSAVSQIILAIGPDLFRLKNEISVLVNYARSKRKDVIEMGDVKRLIKPNNNFKIFDLTDAIGAKNTKKAFSVLQAFRDEGEDEFRIFNLIVHQIRTMVIVDDLISTQLSVDQITKKTGLHPFVVKKTASNLRGFKTSKLLSMYETLENTDWKIKTGQMEIGNAIDFLVVEFCEK